MFILSSPFLYFNPRTLVLYIVPVAGSGSNLHVKMGASSQVVPQCDSPHGLFRLTWTDSHGKARQSLMTVVSYFKKFRFAVPPPFGGPSTGGRRIAEFYDIGWLTLIHFSYVFMAAAFLIIVGEPLILTAVIFPMCSFVVHFVIVYSVLYWHRDMPFQLIGAKVKFLIEVIPMTTAAALNHFELNHGYFYLVLCCSTYFYGFTHFLHIAYDIGGIDVLLGLGKQVLGYKLDGDLLVRALALSFCFGLSFYRYMTYCAPEVPAHCKKEMERLPC